MNRRYKIGTMIAVFQKSSQHFVLQMILADEQECIVCQHGHISEKSDLSFNT